MPVVLTGVDRGKLTKEGGGSDPVSRTKFRENHATDVISRVTVFHASRI